VSDETFRRTWLALSARSAACDRACRTGPVRLLDVLAGSFVEKLFVIAAIAEIFLVLSSQTARRSSGPVYFRKCVKERMFDASVCAAARGVIDFLRGRQGIVGSVHVVMSRIGPKDGFAMTSVAEERPSEYKLETLSEIVERGVYCLAILSQQTSNSLLRTVVSKISGAGILCSNRKPYRPFCLSVHSYAAISSFSTTK
jgi:hypothetical protein